MLTPEGAADEFVLLSLFSDDRPAWPKHINPPCRIYEALINIIVLSSQRWWIRKLQPDQEHSHFWALTLIRIVSAATLYLLVLHYYMVTDCHELWGGGILWEMKVTALSPWDTAQDHPAGRRREPNYTWTVRQENIWHEPDWLHWGSNDRLKGEGV